jgi:hypothetical protein
MPMLQSTDPTWRMFVQLSGLINPPMGTTPKFTAKIQTSSSANHGVKTVKSVTPMTVERYSMTAPRRHAMSFPKKNPI